MEKVSNGNDLEKSQPRRNSVNVASDLLMVSRVYSAMICDTKTTQSPPWNAAFLLANTHAIPDFVADQTHPCLTIVPQSLEVLVSDLIPGLSYEWVYTRRQSQCQKHAEEDTMCVCVCVWERERLPPLRFMCLIYPTLWLSHRYMSDIWRWNF